MGIQQNVNRTIGSLSVLLGIIKHKKDSAKLEKNTSDIPQTNTTVTQQTETAAAPDNTNTSETSTSDHMDPYMAAEKAQTAIDDKQLEYSFSKPKATIIPFEPKD